MYSPATDASDVLRWIFGVVVGVDDFISVDGGADGKGSSGVYGGGGMSNVSNRDRNHTQFSAITM